MKRATVLHLLLILTALAGRAQESTAALFLTTDPIRAQVFLDGTRLQDTTPLLVRDLAPGTHRIVVYKPGHRWASATVELSPGQAGAVSLELVEEHFHASFPVDRRLRLEGSETGGEGTLFEFPLGTYTVRRGAEQLEIEPVFPGQRWIDGLNLALPILLAVAGLETVHQALIDPRPDGSFSPTPALWSVYGVTAAAVGFDLALLHRKKVFRRSFSYNRVPPDRSPKMAAELYEQGEDLLALARVDEALVLYTRVVTEHPETIFFPRALYKAARIHHLKGKLDLALFEYRLVAERYPLPDLYDRSWKALADIHLSRGEYDRSLECLQKMIYVDPQFSREEIDAFRGEIRKAGGDR